MLHNAGCSHSEPDTRSTVTPPQNSRSRASTSEAKDVSYYGGLKTVLGNLGLTQVLKLSGTTRVSLSLHNEMRLYNCLHHPGHADHKDPL